MSKTVDLAVIGATGTVGEALVQLLEEREFPVGNLHLLAGGDSAGQSVPFRGKNLRVRELAGFDFTQVGQEKQDDTPAPRGDRGDRERPRGPRRDRGDRAERGEARE